MRNQSKTAARSLLLLGGSGAGKTHYTGQLTVRIDRTMGRIKIRGAAESYAAYEDVRNRLSQGLSAGHTPTDKYDESGLPLLLDEEPVDLMWPDYGGEQIRHIVERRRWSRAWQERINAADGWLLFVRLDRLRKFHDIFSRPPGEIRISAHSPSTSPPDAEHNTEALSGDGLVPDLGLQPEARPDSATEEGPAANVDFDWSGQAFLVELLQILLFARKAGTSRRLSAPRLTVVLSCWDELHIEGEFTMPSAVLRQCAPMLCSFIEGNWKAEALCILGLSSLEKPLDDKTPDEGLSRLRAGAFRLHRVARWPSR